MPTKKLLVDWLLRRRELRLLGKRELEWAGRLGDVVSLLALERDPGKVPAADGSYQRYDWVSTQLAKVVRKMAASEKGQRLLGLWSCDCAEHVLPIYEGARPGDARLSWALRKVRRVLEGEGGDDDLLAAERVALEVARVEQGILTAHGAVAEAVLHTVSDPTVFNRGPLAQQKAQAGRADAYWRETEWQVQALIWRLRGFTSDPPAGLEGFKTATLERCVREDALVSQRRKRPGKSSSEKRAGKPGKSSSEKRAGKPGKSASEKRAGKPGKSSSEKRAKKKRP